MRITLTGESRSATSPTLRTAAMLHGSYACGSGTRVSSNARHRLSALCRYVGCVARARLPRGGRPHFPRPPNARSLRKKLPSDAPALPLLRAKAPTAARPDVAPRWPGPPRSRPQRARGQSTRGQRTWPPPPNWTRIVRPSAVEDNGPLEPPGRPGCFLSHPLDDDLRGGMAFTGAHAQAFGIHSC